MTIDGELFAAGNTQLIPRHERCGAAVTFVAAGADRMNTARITQARGVFSMTCGIELNIQAPAARIWSLLTDATDFPRWNSTVTRVEGQIREGEQLRLHVPGTDRTFTPRVSGVVPDERMTWTGGFAPVFKGVRTFELRPRDDGSTDFVMEERFSGLMLPLVKGSMPDFGPVFERYANDLKHEAELMQPCRSLKSDREK